MKKAYDILLFIVIFASAAGCAVIAGHEDADAPATPQLTFQFVESLRNAASLQGAGLREENRGADPAVSLQQPNAVHADAFRVVVTDLATAASGTNASARVFVFDRARRTATALPIPVPPAEGKLLAPSGVSVEGNRVVYVSDSQQGKVFGYDLNGTLLMVLGRMGDLSSPAAVAVDAGSGRIYVADSHAHAVKAYSTMGALLSEIKGEFKNPVALAVDREGVLHVLDGKARRVALFGRDGKFVRSFPLTGGKPGASVRPKGLAVDSQGRVYVSDAVQNTVLIFDREGKFVQSWGRTGILHGDFWTPSGLFIDERDQIYICDLTNGRVQVYQYIK